MNITKTNIDDLSAVITLQVNKTDYEPNVEKALKDYRKKANINGFRAGMAPMGMIKKMYGKHVLLDEVNKLISDSLNKYLTDSDIKILGEPLPKTDQEPIDFDTQSDFNVSFEVGLNPEFEIDPSKKDKVTYYNISVTDEMLTKSKENHSRRFGSFVEIDTIVGNEMLKGDIAQVDAKGNVVADGIAAMEVSIYLELAKDEDEKKKFIGAKKGDMITFDVKKAFPNDFELSNILKIEKDKAASVEGNFKFSIRTISKFQNAEFNKDLFDKIYGPENTLDTEEQFNEKITAELKANLDENSNYKFLIDAKEYFSDKAKMKIPTDFLKRWLKYANEGKLTEEQIEKEFPLFEKDLKWQLIRTKLVTKAEIKVEETEVIEYAKKVAISQFQQYGIMNIPDEHLTSYAVDILKKEGEVRRIMDRVADDKVLAFLKENVTLQEKSITSEEFNKFFENQ